jgi:hypothetical protein
VNGRRRRDGSRGSPDGHDPKADDLVGSDIVAHRLAYIPCPFIVDTEFLEEGDPIDEVVGMYVELSDVALRSPIRFDYDLLAAKENHPTAHLTLNSADCRIACVAPMHVLRFVDFTFRHFIRPCGMPIRSSLTWRPAGIWEARSSRARIVPLRT